MADQITTTSRVCSKCGITKPATTEHFDNYRDRGKVRQRTFCKECRNARLRAYRAANPDKVAEWDRRNRERNRGAGSAYEKRRYARRDKAAALEKLKLWKAENPEKVRQHWERTYEKNKSKHAAKVRKWRRMKRRTDPAFRETANKRNREWYQKNKETMRDYYRERAAIRRKCDIDYRIKCSLRTRVGRALRGKAKAGSVTALLGCSVTDARRHIERLFQPGMTWANWGRGWGGAREWHIDHIRPLASFDLTDPSQLAAACHYTNLQPLWAEDNVAKGAS